MSDRSLSVIAAEIRADWPRGNQYCEEQLQGMEQCSDLDTLWYAETGADAVIGFLNNSRGWTGENARRIRAELRAMLKAHGHKLK